MLARAKIVWPVGENPATGSHRQRLLDCLAIAAVMLAISAALVLLHRVAGMPRTIDAPRVPWPDIAFGIAVAALFYRGLNRWPGVLFGVFGTALLGTLPWGAAALHAVAATICAIGIRALLRAWRVDGALQRWQDPLLLWCAAAFGAALLASFAGTVVLMVGGRMSAATEPEGLARTLLDAHGLPKIGIPLFRLVGGWWANWTSGVALIVPVLRLLDGATWRALADRRREVLVIALLLPAWGAFAFAPLPWVFGLPLCLIALVLVTWSAIRFGAVVSAAVVLALALVECAAFIAGRGPLQAQSDQAIVVVWTFIIVVSMIGMLITSLLAERDAASRRKVASEARYRTLFESNPQPLWVQEPGSLQILMVNESAVRHYGYTREEFLALTATDLEAQDPSYPAAGDADADPPEGHERLHRTRDGTLISVNLWSHAIDFDGREAVLVFSHDVTDSNRLRTAFIDATDRAARQIGQELHDGLGQELVGLSLITRSQTTKLVRGIAVDAETLGMIDRIAQRAVLACRNIAHGLSALTETGGDIAVALERLPERFVGDGMPAISVDIRNEIELVVPDAVRDHVYRIAQEALTNAVKHAHARRVDIRFAVTSTHVVLSVRDDGVGLPRHVASGCGLGLSSMRHRAAAIGARLYVASPDGGGTEIRVEIRFDPAASEAGRRNARNGDANPEADLPKGRKSRRAG